ncbi:MAG: filamentous hemagglutinin N-terminal domain-containing protein, partial [Betaproteobacteria bacterium]|nr:filamentous hemagglutinin N-terminal domain-containing protein [Betaproteobacteria bacterium]
MANANNSRNSNALRILALAALAVPLAANSGVTLDGTLGPAGPLSGPNYAIPANLGRQVGANLFHSFSVFNLGRGEVATFSGPASTVNVIGRVTGGSPSAIDGMLRST